MDQADSELKETIKHIWPLQAKKILDLLVPPNDQLNTGKMTVGKMYGGLLILESWKINRFGQTDTEMQVNKECKFIIKTLSTPKNYIKHDFHYVSSRNYTIPCELHLWNLLHKMVIFIQTTLTDLIDHLVSGHILIHISTFIFIYLTKMCKTV